MDNYKNKLLDRLQKFAVSIIILANKLPHNPTGYAIASQIIRSGTSIGANCHEAQDAFSYNDFANSINISLKEAKETEYWLTVMQLAGILSESEIKPILAECKEIIAILVKSVKTIKEKKLEKKK